MKRNDDINIRMATPDDASDLLDIYAPYVLKTGVTFEYDVPSEEAFRERIKAVLKKYPYLIALRENRIVGYAYAQELGERAAFSHSVETAIYLSQRERGKGTGSLLYCALENILKRQNVTNLYAAVSYREREDETITHASPLFHLACGYRKAAHFRQCGYKFGRWYDIVWYEKHIADHADEPPAFISVTEMKIDRNSTCFS